MIRFSSPHFFTPLLPTTNQTVCLKKVGEIDSTWNHYPLKVGKYCDVLHSTYGYVRSCCFSATGKAGKGTNSTRSQYKSRIMMFIQGLLIHYLKAKSEDKHSKEGTDNLQVMKWSVYSNKRKQQSTAAAMWRQLLAFWGLLIGHCQVFSDLVNSEPRDSFVSESRFVVDVMLMPSGRQRL